jgi:MoaA/NifB/PqqE/SkfB family radical SAM enzyme
MNVNDIKGFHIELTNMCTLKCPGCARTQFIDQWPQHWQNHNIDIDQLLKFLDIDLSGKRILLCGNYGDPIYHPQFIKLVQQLKQHDTHLKIVTNGSYKSIDWWEQLVKLLDQNDIITFSIDGIPENFDNYRVNADWDTIQHGLTVVGESDVSSEWKFIPFNFNIKDIDRANAISKRFNVDNFVVTPSDRFDRYTEKFRPIQQNYIGGKESTKDIIVTDLNSTVNVNPSCLNDKASHFISAQGYYSPCCYVSDHRFYYKTIFGRTKKQFNINNNKFSELLQRNDVLDFYDSLDQNLVCKYNCPKI